jgi:putative oxygen-independent coproporphyrinogen III oxidase
MPDFTLPLQPENNMVLNYKLQIANYKYDVLVPLGLYISVPFCRTKCTFCNFASGVFSRELFDRYITHVTADISNSQQLAAEMGARFDRTADSIYLGGGTPSVLAPDQLESIFRSVRENFSVTPAAEITVECAPGTLTPEIIESLVRCGVNRVSLGVQSFVDQESRAVGRLHTRDITLADIANLRAAGISEISIDLIAGLPHQSVESWRYSLAETIAAGVPHVSVYMLEVDDDSRLGRELIAGGTRYHAHFVPDDDATADFYLEACATLNAAGIHQYEISNFARHRLYQGSASAAPSPSGAINNFKPSDLYQGTASAVPSPSGAINNFNPSDLYQGTASAVPSQPGNEAGALAPAHASRHNLKYWLRHPYLGFGVDAHSMLPAPQRTQPHAAVRFATPDNLDALLADAPRIRTEVDERAAIEEAWFLGLRLNRGVELLAIHEEFGIDAVERYREPLAELVGAGLLALDGGFVRLTDRGRLLSNEVFGRFILSESPNSDTPPTNPTRTPFVIL